MTDAYYWATTGNPVELDTGSANDAAQDHKEATDVYDSAPTTTKEAILAHLRVTTTPVTTGVIARDLDVPLSTVSTSLKRLAEHGHVTAVRHGTWRATEHELIDGDEGEPTDGLEAVVGS